MTEEELEKFTVDFMNNETGTNWSRIDSIMGKMLIKYAEVFQNRIEELEKENAELRAKESFVGDQNRKLCEQQQKIEVLEAENAELKRLKRECETSLCRAEYQYNYEQLTKAKFLLKQLVDAFPKSYSDVVKDTLKQAEQFLNSEVEK